MNGEEEVGGPEWNASTLMREGLLNIMANSGKLPFLVVI